MYLKSIEIRGFKSFADKTHLDFKEGITAVVGPNGSGKSNISDAVRWVLGEQSVKSLRGGKMEDIIFAGTEYRKALGFAEVTLLLDNTSKSLPIPFSEVSVTRKLFRSGESEYLINKSTCRLRDIHELFMDTGIGKEGYSLIGQGKIEAILSGKMEDRRALLEEAAGIVKFKSRKEEGEKKLANTDLNLLRVNDILTTYEERLEPLRREKEKAEKFLVLSGEQKEIMISLIISDLEDMEIEEAKISIDEKQTTQRFQIVSNERESTTARKESLDLAIETSAQETAKLREEFYIRRGDSESLQMEKKSLAEGIHLQEKTLEKNRTSMENLVQRGSEEQEFLDGLVRELSESEGEKEQLLRNLEEKRDILKSIELELKQSEETQKGLRDEDEDTDARIEQQKNEALKIYAEKADLSARIDNEKSMMTNYEASLTINEKARDDVSEKLRELEKAHAAMASERETLKRESSKFRGDIEEQDRNLRNLSEEIRGAESQIKLLKNLESHYEGYNRSVKSLMEHLKATNSRYQDKTHLVGEVVKPKAGFETALEIALGAGVSNIITRDDRQAKELIGLLREKNLGRATFLPQNIIKGSQAKTPVLKNGKLLGNLMDFIEVHEEFRSIAMNLLGRIFIAKDLEDATASAKEMGYSNRIITLKGDVVNAGGSMTGGSLNQKSSGIFSRKKDLVDLEESLIALRKSREDRTMERQQALKVYEVKEGKVRELAYAINGLDMEIVKQKERHEAFTTDLKRLQHVILESRRLLEDRKSEFSLVLDEISHSEKRIADLMAQKQRNRTYLQELKEKRTSDFKAFDDLKETISTIMISEGRLLESYKAKEEDRQRREQLVTSFREQQLDLVREEKDIAIEIASLKERADQAKKDLEETLSFLEEREKEIERLAMEEIRDKAVLRDLSNALRTLDEEYHVLDKDLFRKREGLEKIGAERTTLITRINDELDMTLAEAREERIVIEDTDAARKRLNQLRREISALGSVNVAAIEEYREVSAHREFLTSQKDDLEHAKNELKELIMEMTLRMRTMFTENFKILSENFEDTFRRLFSGGQAKLLLGEGDVLEAPIEISVQPPGKKLQNITLMSGGEKVLSAIALTFAILRMKPTPFCILDEIEAALDESNVARFAAFLKEFARETQFILITHRKGTMESADVLYGVTMEEKGISKIVSVDLSAERRKREIG